VCGDKYMATEESEPRLMPPTQTESAPTKECFECGGPFHAHMAPKGVTVPPSTPNPDGSFNRAETLLVWKYDSCGATSPFAEKDILM
jgi:hypothetical protein